MHFKPENINTFAKKITLVRIPEHNDWVIWIVLGCIALYTVMLQGLQRDSAVRDFIVQDLADRSNLFPSWLLISLVNVLLLSIIVSRFVPMVPAWLESWTVLGIGLNKFGFTFWALSLLYILRAVLTYLFYAFTGDAKRFDRLYFLASKFYFILSAIAGVAAVALYYLPVDRLIFINILIISAPLIMLFKTVFYAAHRLRVLPDEWYYKILYICTLQFAPMLALWQLLFF